MTGELCERCGVRLAVDDGYCRPCARVLDGPAATGGRPGHWLPRAAVGGPAVGPGSRRDGISGAEAGDQAPALAAPGIEREAEGMTKGGERVKCPECGKARSVRYFPAGSAGKVPCKRCARAVAAVGGQVPVPTPGPRCAPVPLTEALDGAPVLDLGREISGVLRSLAVTARLAADLGDPRAARLARLVLDLLEISGKI